MFHAVGSMAERDEVLHVNRMQSLCSTHVRLVTLLRPWINSVQQLSLLDNFEQAAK